MPIEKDTGQKDLTMAMINLIQSNPICLMGPISASVNGLEFDVEIGRYLGPDDRWQTADSILRASEACQEACLIWEAFATARCSHHIRFALQAQLWGRKTHFPTYIHNLSFAFNPSKVKIHQCSGLSSRSTYNAMIGAKAREWPQQVF